MNRELRARLDRTRATYSVPDDEGEHFITCPVCGTEIDCRKLGGVLEHEDRCIAAANDPGEIAAALIVPTSPQERREDMADDRSKRGGSDRRRVAGGQGYEASYFARKHGLSLDQARQLIQRVGNDREKLNAAAEKLKRA